MAHINILKFTENPQSDDNNSNRRTIKQTEDACALEMRIVFIF